MIYTGDQMKNVTVVCLVIFWWLQRLSTKKLRIKWYWFGV